MILGYTGTHQGMSMRQLLTVAQLIHDFDPEEEHHGDCIGGDSQFHYLCWAVLRDPAVIIHPPTDPRKRAFCEPVGRYGVVLPPKPYLKRNYDVVDQSGHLLAAPVDKREVLRSGTWATMRYAVKVQVPVTVVWPDGKWRLWEG